MMTVACPRCPADTGHFYTDAERGRLAAHLVEVHAVSASHGLTEARKAFGLTTMAPGPQPPTPSPTKEILVAVPKTWKCGTCGRGGHTARTFLAEKTTAKPPTATNGARPARKEGPVPTGAIVALRAEIAEKQRQIAALESALAILEG